MTIPFLQVKPRSIKLKISPRFPALLNDGIGTEVVKTNGNYQINLDYAQFLITNTLPPDPLYSLIWDGQTNQYILTPLSVATGGISEAPMDGTIYGRINASWARVSSPQATTAQYLADVPNLTLVTDRVWAAAGIVGLTDAATISVDMSTFINASVTLGGNRTLGNPSNPKPGQTGVIQITQDATGSRTLAYGSNWKFASGTAPVLTTTAAAVDLLFYQVISSTFIFATFVGNVH